MSDATVEKSGHREFKLNVYPIDNTPDVPTSGLQVSMTCFEVDTASLTF